MAALDDSQLFQPSEEAGLGSPSVKKMVLTAISTGEVISRLFDPLFP